MKVSEFRSIIREEVKRALREAPREPEAGKKTEMAKRLGISVENAQDYKVGRGTRQGVPVDVPALRAEISKTAENNLKALEKSGIVFDSAYAMITTLSDWGVPKEVLTYTFFGHDSKGNEVAYDKYESGAASAKFSSTLPGSVGGGQSYVFVNGKKLTTTNYMNDLASLPLNGEIVEFLESITGPVPQWAKTHGIFRDPNVRAVKLNFWYAGSFIERWNSRDHSSATPEEAAYIDKTFNKLKSKQKEISEWFSSHGLSTTYFKLIDRRQKNEKYILITGTKGWSLKDNGTVEDQFTV